MSPRTTGSTGKKKTATLMATAPRMLPALTIRVVPTTVTKTASAIAMGMGASPRKTPALVATPLPPRNLRNSEKVCPAMAARPQTRGA